MMGFCFLQLFDLFLLFYVPNESRKLIVSLSNCPKSTGIVLDNNTTNPQQQIYNGYHKHPFKHISGNELNK